MGSVVDRDVFGAFHVGQKDPAWVRICDSQLRTNFCFWDCRSVAGGTLFWRRLVKEHWLAFHHFCQLVAVIATHIAMCPFEGKSSTRVVIKSRWFPARAVVATGAVGYAISGELLTVNFGVTLLAFCRSRMEVHMNECGFQVCGLVAIDAGNPPVRSQQRERGLRVVKSRHIFPGFGGMTSFASGSTSVQDLRHPIAELATMGILMTSRAGHIIKAVHRRVLHLGRLHGLVTFSTGDRHVRVGENESSLLMTRQAEGRGLESFQRMALLTTVDVWRGGKLGLVLVFVALQTAVKLEFVDGIFASRNMALRALHGRMFCLQRISSRRVFLHTEERRLESIDVVA